MLSRRFLIWLRKLAASRTQQELEDLIGMDQTRISTHLKKSDAEGVNIDLDTLWKIARKYRPGTAASALLAEIEQERDPDARPSSERRAEAAYRAWLKLFEHDPARGRRVILNLEAQEDLEMTELISRVVYLIIKIEDAGERQRAVVNALADFEKVKRSAKMRRRIAAYVEEYAAIH